MVCYHFLGIIISLICHFTFVFLDYIHLRIINSFITFEVIFRVIFLYTYNHNITRNISLRSCYFSNDPLWILLYIFCFQCNICLFMKHFIIGSLIFIVSFFNIKRFFNLCCITKLFSLGFFMYLSPFISSILRGFIGNVYLVLNGCLLQLISIFKSHFLGISFLLGLHHKLYISFLFISNSNSKFILDYDILFL